MTSTRTDPLNVRLLRDDAEAIADVVEGRASNHTAKSEAAVRRVPAGTWRAIAANLRAAADVADDLARNASSHFGVRRDGQIDQYLPLGEDEEAF